MVAFLGRFFDRYRSIRTDQPNSFLLYHLQLFQTPICNPWFKLYKSTEHPVVLFNASPLKPDSDAINPNNSAALILCLSAIFCIPLKNSLLPPIRSFDAPLNLNVLSFKTSFGIIVPDVFGIKIPYCNL